MFTPENVIHTMIGGALVSVLLFLIVMAFWSEIKQIGKPERKHAHMTTSSEVIKRGHRK